MKMLYEIKKKKTKTKKKKKKKKKTHIIEGMLIPKEKDIYERCNCIFGSETEY